VIRASIKVAVAIFMCMTACGACCADDTSAVFMLDTSIEQASGARTRLGFERLAAEGEKAIWKDPNGKLDNTAVALLAGGGLLGGGFADARAQSERNATIHELRDGVSENDRLKEVFRSELRRSAEGHSYHAEKVILAHGLSAGHVSRGLEIQEEDMAIALQKADGPIVALSWDDRQPLLAVDMRLYERRVRGQGVREKARRIVRYVGYEAPPGKDPRKFWSADSAARFLSEVQGGIRHMLPLFWDDSIDVPKVPRKETVAVQVAGTPRVFPGRLWKQEEGVAYLFNSDRGITIVSTAGSPAPQ
jgi:hypothetical protein